jgi:hypothetical protein
MPGLQERRKIHELSQQVLPQRSQEIADICGAAVPYEVDWASLENDAQALNFLDNTACHRLNMALRMICIDDLGRQAVAGGLRLVRCATWPTRRSATSRCRRRARDAQRLCPRHPGHARRRRHPQRAAGRAVSAAPTFETRHPAR